MGFIPLLLLCGLTFLISRMWKGERSLLAGGILVSGIVFLLAVCNRFSFYPIDTVVIQSDFVSTLGNINWFCGYLSVVAPLGIGLFVLDEEGSGKDGHILRRRIKRGALLVYTILTFVAGFCQGSSSIFIWYGALFFLLLWICVEKEKWIKNWFLMIALWGSSAQLVRLWRYIAPERYNYDVDNACGYFTDSGLTLWIAIAGFCGYLILCLRSRKRTEEKKAGEEDGTVSDKEKRTKINSKSKIFRKILVCVLLIVAAAWIGLIVINTCVGIPFLEENQMFLFDRNWGNGRGSAWQAAFAMLKEMPFLQKLIGVGPDGFADLAYSLPEVSDMLYEEFGNSRLTNAHCELLTCLVNWGVAGTLAYLGMFISFTLRCFRGGKEKPVLYAMAVCLLCYLCHNVVSFAQVLNIPFVFLILGMGEALLRKSQNAQEIKDETQSGAGCGASSYECED